VESGFLLILHQGSRRSRGVARRVVRRIISDADSQRIARIRLVVFLVAVPGAIGGVRGGGVSGGGEAAGGGGRGGVAAVDEVLEADDLSPSVDDPFVATI